MALIPASINLTFNANYTGCHRACWREQGTVPYDCATQVNCAGGGLPCNMTISLQIDDASCVPVTYEGYSQACCEDVASVNGRLPFSVTFTPTADCLGYTVTCVGPFTIADVVITAPGSGYPTGAPIAVVFTPALGGVAASAIIGDGGIPETLGAITYVVLGAGYTDGTYNNVPAVNTVPQSGIGVGALFDVVITGGQISSATIVPGSNGTLYLVNDNITFNDVDLGGGGGTGILLAVAVLNTGEVQQINITNPGSLYTAVPTATVPGGIVGATLVAVLSNCPTVDLPSCGNPLYNIPAIPANASFMLCSDIVPTIPVEYTATPGACCNDCVTVTFSKPALQTAALVYYQDCTTKEMIGASITGGGSIGPVCAVNNSWIIVEDEPVTGITTVLTGASC